MLRVLNLKSTVTSNTVVLRCNTKNSGM